MVSGFHIVCRCCNTLVGNAVMAASIMLHGCVSQTTVVCRVCMAQISTLLDLFSLPLCYSFDPATWVPREVTPVRYKSSHGPQCLSANRVVPDSRVPISMYFILISFTPALRQEPSGRCCWRMARSLVLCTPYTCICRLLTDTDFSCMMAMARLIVIISLLGTDAGIWRLW